MQSAYYHLRIFIQFAVVVRIANTNSALGAFEKGSSLLGLMVRSYDLTTLSAGILFWKGIINHTDAAYGCPGGPWI